LIVAVFIATSERWDNGVS